MPGQEMTCLCRLLRYTPNLLRDEHLNIGVVLHEPASGRAELRVVETESELARVRRLHPSADLDLMRRLDSELRWQMAQHGGDTQAWLTGLDQTLSNAVQLGPQRAVLTEDFDAELDRIYRDQVAPLRATRAEATHSRAALRTRANEAFGRAGVLHQLRRGVRVEEFTYPGDPMRLDYGYQRNGTPGFLHTLALDRDLAQAKALAFTGEHIRQRAARAEISAIFEDDPREDNPRHRFVSQLLAAQGIALLPLPKLEGWARELRLRLQ
jgi:hypothetical protein